MNTNIEHENGNSLPNELRNSLNTFQNSLVTKIVADTFLDNVKTYLGHVQIFRGMQLASLGIINPGLIDIERART